MQKLGNLARLGISMMCHPYELPELSELTQLPKAANGTPFYFFIEVAPDEIYAIGTLDEMKQAREKYPDAKWLYTLGDIFAHSLIFGPVHD